MSETTWNGKPQGNGDISRRGYLEGKGFWSWAYTLDHKRIGVMYLYTTLFFFLVGGVFALLIRIKLMFPGEWIFSNQTYNVLFTMHGALMIFLFIIPAIPSGLGNFFIPLHIGARDVAFPRINLMSYWVFVAGIVVILVSLVRPMDTGWTFYTPYSAKTSADVTLLSFGIFLIGMSSILTGLNFLVTIHKLRAPGMTWHRMPLFIWSMYATSIIQVLATPVVGITFLLLAMERMFGVGFFDPAKGGDPILFQHFFWFYSHPVVYVMILPAMGVISEVVPVFSRKPIFGYNAIAYSSVAIAVFGFFVWGHHMFVSGMSGTAAIIFSLLTFSVAIPTAVKVFNWIATMYKGSITFESPMLYALTFIFLFVVGGLTGMFLGALGSDIHVHDTYFIVAHFHYTMMGGTVMGLLAGLHFWFPKMTGRMLSEKMARYAGALCLAAHVCRLQRHLLHPVHHGVRGDAQTLRGIPGAIPDAQHSIHGGLVGPRGGNPHHVRELRPQPVPGGAGSPEPLESAVPGLADRVAASHGEFRGNPDGQRLAVQLREQESLMDRNANKPISGSISAHGLAGGFLSATLATFARSLPVPLAAISILRRDTPFSLDEKTRSVPPLRGTPRSALCSEYPPAPHEPGRGPVRQTLHQVIGRL
jgi:cytochrome c oxidase subunit 1